MTFFMEVEPPVATLPLRVPAAALPAAEEAVDAVAEEAEPPQAVRAAAAATVPQTARNERRVIFFIVFSSGPFRPGRSCYAVAIGISFVVPKLFTAIAFDAGGVASGPMTATFLLPLAQGACVAVGGNIVTDAFGVVAMVAMTPLITVQLMGLAAQLKTGRRRAARAAEPALAGVAAYADWPDDDIIEL